MNHSSQSIPVSPRRDQEIMRKINTTKSLIQMGCMTSNQLEATKILHDACVLLEQSVSEFDQRQQLLQQQQREQELYHQPEINPFSTLLAQARHRLGQIALAKGDLATASQLFLQVILYEPHSLSPAALAMSWYDVGLICAHWGRIQQSQVALRQSFQTLVQHSQPGAAGADETLLYFIQIAMQRLVDISEGKILSTTPMHSLPFSNQFTVVTYNYSTIDLEDESSSDQVRRATEESHLHPSLHAAGAA